MLGGIANFYEQCTQKVFSIANLECIIKEGFCNREKFKAAFERFGFFPWATENWHLTLRDECYDAAELEILNSLRKDPLVGVHNPAYFGLNATDEYVAEIYPLVVDLLSTASDLFKPRTMMTLLLKNLSFFKRMEDEYLQDNRHTDARLQHEYDKRFGLVLM